MGIVEDFFGSGNKFFLRDFRNASHLRPDVNPPRQQHQGYVNFILNRDLFGFLFGEPDRMRSTFTIESSEILSIITLSNYPENLLLAVRL